MVDDLTEKQDIRPRVGDKFVPIPLTLEVPRVNGAQRYRNRVLFSIGLGVVAFLFVTPLVFFGFQVAWYWKPIWYVVIMYCIGLALRYFALEERDYRKDFSRQYRTDYEMPTNNLWGIYHIEPAYPHICHYRTGRIGIFVAFDKDVKIGRDTDDDRFAHFQAIADAYQEAGQRGAMITHIDYMGVIGVDDRFEGLYADLADVDNTDVRDLLTAEYAYLEERLEESTTPLDVYCISLRGTFEDLWDAFSAFSQNMLNANYLSYSILDAEGIRRVTLDVFNLEEFSAVDASLKSITESYAHHLKPLGLIHPDGTRTSLSGSSTSAPTRRSKR